MTKIKEGSITHRKDGRYMGRYVDNDKRIRYVYALSYKDCVAKLNEAISHRDRYDVGITFGFLKLFTQSFKKS